MVRINIVLIHLGILVRLIYVDVVRINIVLVLYTQVLVRSLYVQNNYCAIAHPGTGKVCSEKCTHWF